MKLPLIAFFVILASIIFLRWWQNLPKEIKEEKPGGKKKEENKEMKPMEIFKISMSGAIFLILLYVLYPDFVSENHKEIIVFVAAMMTGSMLLGVWEGWEKSSARKILKAHLAIYSIIIILGMFYKIPVVRSWMEDFQKKSALQSQAATTVFLGEFTLKTGDEIPTVEAGPGTHHRLWANKPYRAVSVQRNGSRKLYNMPAGWESWIGAEPTGRLRLIGKENDTAVKIYLYQK